MVGNNHPNRSKQATIEHTPTPWANERGLIYALVDGVRVAVAATYEGPKAKWNGETIVRAVNAHDALVKELQFVRNKMAMPVEIMQGWPEWLVERIELVVRGADAALALANGEG